MVGFFRIPKVRELQQRFQEVIQILPPFFDKCLVHVSHCFFRWNWWNEVSWPLVLQDLPEGVKIVEPSLYNCLFILYNKSDIIHSMATYFFWINAFYYCLIFISFIFGKVNFLTLCLLLFFQFQCWIIVFHFFHFSFSFFFSK